jgi:hypothetical protein
VVLAFEHLAGRGVGVAADLDAEALGIAVVHLVLGELAALHAQHLDPLDLFPGRVPRDWLFSSTQACTQRRQPMHLRMFRA